MNNKAIIELGGFRRIWRNLQISDGVIHLDLRRRWVALSSNFQFRILHILRKPNSIIANYYSFRIFPRFWLVKTTRTIGTISSCCWPRILSYWTNDVKSAVRCRLLNHWRQNDVKSAARCRLLNHWKIRRRWITLSSTCRILHILLSLIQ